MLNTYALGFKVFLAAGDMPKECGHLRTSLEIEYQKLLAWSDAAGLLQYEYGQNFPDTLKTDKLVLVAVLSQIKLLMDEFASLNGRYRQLQHHETEEEKIARGDVDILSESASISLKYEKTATERKRLRGTNRILAMAKDLKGVATEPKRLWWTVFDADIFKELLQKIHGYNDYLNELLRSQQARKLEETTQNTYLEMVQIRSSVQELKDLFGAVLLLDKEKVNNSGSRPSTKLRPTHTDQFLQLMSNQKVLVLQNELEDKPPSYDLAVARSQIEKSAIKYDPSKAYQSGATPRTRTPSTYVTGSGKTLSTWIEWKIYRAELEYVEKPSFAPTAANVTRIRELVALLQHSNIFEFRIPQCVGYFDERIINPRSEQPNRFGVVFVKPDQSDGSPDPVSLLEAFKSHRCPSLSARVQLAHKLATSMLYLHAVRWLHKGLRSDSIALFPPATTDGTIDYTEPHLSGFEYARPDRDGVHSTSVPKEPSTEIYMHPSYQGENAVGTYRKTFDLYSLGVVLVEIVFWRRIQDLLGIEQLSQKVLRGVRDQLLGGGTIEKVREKAGDRVADAIHCCVKGPEAFELADMEDEMDGRVGAKLQEQFTRKVVENLAEVVL